MEFTNQQIEIKTYTKKDNSRWISFLDLDTDETIQLRFPRGLVIYHLVTRQQIIFRYLTHDGKWISRSIRTSMITHILDLYSLYVRFVMQVFQTTSHLIDLDVQKNYSQSLVHFGPTPLFVSYGTHDVNGYSPFDKCTTYLCKRDDPRVTKIAAKHSKKIINRMLKYKVKYNDILDSKQHYKGVTHAVVKKHT